MAGGLDHLVHQSHLRPTGWVLAGEVQPCVPCLYVTSHHVALESGDDLLRRFWEIEQQPDGEPIRSLEEKSVVQHFQDTHFRASDGKFVVPHHERQTLVLSVNRDHKLFVVSTTLSDHFTRNLNLLKLML